MGTSDRLVAEAVLSESDFHAIADNLGTKPLKARKTALIADASATAGERIETHWNGSETVNTAKPGDWVATSLMADGEVLRDRDGNANSYVIPAADFPTLYSPVEGTNQFGRFHAARGTVAALHLSGGFEISRTVGRAPDRTRRLPDAQRIGRLRQQRRNVCRHLRHPGATHPAAASADPVVPGARDSATRNHG